MPVNKIIINCTANSKYNLMGNNQLLGKNNSFFMHSLRKIKIIYIYQKVECLSIIHVCCCVYFSVVMFPPVKYKLL